MKSVLVGCVVAALGWVGFRLDRFARYSDYFKISEREIVGATERLEWEVSEVMRALEERGEENLLTFDSDDARRRIEALPRVRKARIRKRYPQKLEIEIDERLPLMAALAGELFWIDEEGVLLAEATVKEIAQAEAPVLTGLRGGKFEPGIGLDQPFLSETLGTLSFLRTRDPEMWNRFAEWHFNSQDEVVGILREGVEVRFGSRDPGEKLAVLDSVLRAKPDLTEATYLDLRFDSQVVYF